MLSQGGAIFHLAFVPWVLGQFFKAQLLGNAIRVSASQYQEIHACLEKYCRLLNIQRLPEVYVVNGNGMMNVMAAKFARTKHITPFSGLVDLMLASGSTDELNFINGHELGHHAAGHTSLWRNLLLAPSRFIPPFDSAYPQAKELTAHRIRLFLADDKEAANHGLIGLACGRRTLMPRTNLDAFQAPFSRFGRTYLRRTLKSRDGS